MIPIHVSTALPTEPSFCEDIRRRVRHGLADVLEWCGEEAGPKPGELTHALMVNSGTGTTLFVSAEMHDRIRHHWRIDTPGG